MINPFSFFFFKPAMIDGMPLEQMEIGKWRQKRGKRNKRWIPGFTEVLFDLFMDMH